MGGGAADERRTRVVPRQEPILDHQCHEMASLPIPDELLAEILLRLPTPADLVRASAGCVSFRRVAANRFFLRRYRKLHTPPLVGFLELDVSAKPVRPFFHTAISPHPSASAVSAVAMAADFSFSFLPAPASDWVLQDTRDGRVLLDRPMRIPTGDVFFPEVVVCDPLHRRYLLLPQVPDDLAATVEDPFMNNKRRLSIQTFFVPTGDGQEAVTADGTSFRVVWMAQCKARIVAFVFSSNTCQWQAVPSRCWSDLSARLPPLTVTRLFYSYSRQYAYGCFYWWIGYKEANMLLVLDTETMEFSIAEPPPEENVSCDFAIVEAGEGRLGMFLLADDMSDLSYFIRQSDAGSCSKWQKVKTVLLSFGTMLIYNTEKFLLLYQPQSSVLEEGGFILDIETFQLEKVCALGPNSYELHAYSNFPPSLLSSPTISNGIREDAGKPMLEQDAEVLPAGAYSHHDENTADTSARGQAGVSRIGDGAD